MEIFIMHKYLAECQPLHSWKLNKLLPLLFIGIGGIPEEMGGGGGELSSISVKHMHTSSFPFPNHIADYTKYSSCQP